jgi:hypothetical protein
LAGATVKIGMVTIAYNLWTPSRRKVFWCRRGIGCANLSGLSMER